MRYHVYTEARHPTGAVAAGHSLTVYDDAAGTQESDIYAAASGGSPLANPVTVPATGIVDFWVTVPVPHVVAQGEATPRPLPVVMSPGQDNVFTADQTLQGHKLVITPGTMIPGTHEWGHIVIDHAPPETVSQIGFLEEGAQRAAVGTDPYSFVAAIATGNNDSCSDRFAIGLDYPYRMAFGDVVTNGLGVEGQPSFRFDANNTVKSDTVLLVQYLPDQTGKVLVVSDTVIETMVLDADGDLTLSGDVSAGSDIHAAGDVSAGGDVLVTRDLVVSGDIAHTHKMLLMSDGTHSWVVTVNSAGVLVTAAAYWNYIANPSFELDTDDDGLADGVRVFGNSPRVPTLVAGRTGGLAQRIVVTPGSTNQNFFFDIPLTAVGAFVPGDPVTASFYYKLSHTGCTITPYVASKNAAGGGVADDLGSALDNHADWTRATVSVASLPATTSRVCLAMSSTDLDTGDTLDITVDDMQIETGAAATDYFDGDTPGSGWEAAANASLSYRG